MTKDKLFKKYMLLLLGAVLVSLVFIIAPLWMVHPPLGRAFLLSIPPNVFLAATWMAGAWWAYEKGFGTFMISTMGMMPVRFMVYIPWVYALSKIPSIPRTPLMVGIAIHFAICLIPEITMLANLNPNKIPMEK